MNKDELLKVVGEPEAWRWWESKWGEYSYNEHGMDGRDCEPLYTEAQLLAMYAKGAADMKERAIPEDENEAVRVFLMCFRGNPNLTVIGMRENMDCAGFSGCWPEWVNAAAEGEHLTKSGAQHWIRHLLIRALPITPTNTEGEQ